MAAVDVIYNEYKNIIKNNEEEHIAEAEKIREYLDQSTAKYHNRVVKTLYIPKIFTNKEVGIFEEIIHTLYGIFDKVIAHYIKSPDYRSLFGFSKELEELILEEAGYTSNIPIARIDLFYNEGTEDFKFCEFNTDGSSAMNEDRELNIAFQQSKAYKEFSALHECSSFELFDSWVEEAVSIYREYKQDENAVPKVAIVDFLEHATINEFYIFKEAFERRGCAAVICDIRHLSWDGEKCYAKNGEEVDLIYRRAVTSDVMEHMPEVQDFLAAFKSKKICLLGDFRTQIIHNKILFKMLHRKETLELLEPEEQLFVKNHIPFTISLDDMFGPEYPGLREKVLADKNDWIIKPEDSYGSRGVHAGVELESDGEWEKILEGSRNKKYILQQFCVPYRLDNIELTKDGYRWMDTSNLTGLFVYNGKLKGVYSRISYDHMISTQYNEMTLPTIVVNF